MDKIKLTVNDKEIEINAGLTVLQACEKAEIEIPIFCYHPKLSIAGNCRMCLVEVDKASKLIASCAVQAVEGMAIRTNTDIVKKARKGVLEFLLINHPLDCPICDQGGECDLQDITFSYGPDVSRYEESKRAVEDKNIGPLIKTVMTRCIHCTRCIRFSNEIAGTPELGSVGRGEDMEITTYIEKELTSELSGNMIDICPVGALTSKPYAFQGRSWELKNTQSIDVHDAVGSNISVGSREGCIMRILPRSNEFINEEWISDKVRFSYDGLQSQRLDSPYKKLKGQLQTCTWEEALEEASCQIKKREGKEIAGLVGPLMECESIFSFRELLKNIDCQNMDCRLEGEFIERSSREKYLFNTTIDGIEESDAVLFVGTNPRIEAPLINARWRKRYLKKGLLAGLIGEACDLTFPCDHLGDTAQSLQDIYEGIHPFIKKFEKAKNPMIVIGMGALTRKDSQNIYNLCRAIAHKYDVVMETKNNFNILHTKASIVGALDLSFVPENNALDAAEIYQAVKSGKIKVLYLLGADDIPLTQNDVKNTFVIYQGHHGDKGAHLADLILPGVAYTEKDGTYVNTEGCVQRAFKAVWAPGEAKEDWRILRNLSEVIGKTLPYDTLVDLRECMSQANSIFKEGNHKVTNYIKSSKKKEADFQNLIFLPDPLKSSINNFYMTDVISRHSKTMALCTEAFDKKSEKEKNRHA